MLTPRLTLDCGLYVAHALFWLALAIARHWGRRRGAATPTGTVLERATIQPAAMRLVVVHGLGFFVMYAGIGDAVFGAGAARWFAEQRLAGAGLIALAVAVGTRGIHILRSWRFVARLDAGHELTTGGIFAWVRHPIYLSIDLLALGSAVWAPTWLTWLGFVCIAWGGDLRARGEERVLRRGFGAVYTDYCARTARFVPGVY